MPTDQNMIKLAQLTKSALKSCEARGHLMAAFIHAHDDTAAISHCVSCRRQALVLTNPQPNQIDIGGEAVALECK